MKGSLTSALSPDGRTMLIEVSSDGKNLAGVAVDASELDTVILNLALHRSNMEPKIPLDLDPNPKFRNIVRGATFHLSAVIEPPSTKGEVSLALHHPGLGWIAVRMMPERAAELASIIMMKADEAYGKSRLVGPDGKPV